MKKKPLAPLHIFNDNKRTQIRSFLNREQIKKKFNIVENQTYGNKTKKVSDKFAKNKADLISSAFFFANSNRTQINS